MQRVIRSEMTGKSRGKRVEVRPPSLLVRSYVTDEAVPQILTMYEPLSLLVSA